MELLNRREWVKCFALGWAAALTGGARSTLLAEISPSANPANVIELKVSDYPVLANAYGSVRLSLFNQLIAGGKMILSRAPGDVFHAVSAVCTHAGQIAEPYDNTEFTESIYCYGHGSRYSIEGVVLSPVEDGGGPIPQPNLPKYNTAYANGVVRVEVPSLGFKLNTITVLSQVEGSKRLALNFTPRNGGIYRVKYTPDLVTTPVAVNFATGSGGLASFTQVTASSNSPRTFYVDSTQDRGFYFIELVVTLETAFP
jgi:nitrite reductase/ring-hydroxylating ferredoxin subunit